MYIPKSILVKSSSPIKRRSSFTWFDEHVPFPSYFYCKTEYLAKIMNLMVELISCQVLHNLTMHQDLQVQKWKFLILNIGLKKASFSTPYFQNGYQTLYPSKLLWKNRTLANHNIMIRYLNYNLINYANTHGHSHPVIV